MADVFCIDMESLGTTDDAVILSMGVAVFKEEWLEELLEDLTQEKFQELFLRIVSGGLHMKFKVAEQSKKFNRKIDQGTLDWWAGQGESAKTVLSPNKKEDVSIEEIPATLFEWFKKNKRPKKGAVYSRGMIDARWFQSMLNDVGIDSASKESPIKWWDFRDVRTIIDELVGSANGYMPKKYAHLVDFREHNIKHNAMHDAASDCLNIVLARILA